MAWSYLIIAGLLEIVGIIGLKKVSENNCLPNNLIVIGGFIVSFTFLTLAMQKIQLSTAYAVWTGIGTLGAAIIGIVFFNEPRNLLRILCIIGIVFTIAGIRIVS